MACEKGSWLCGFAFIFTDSAGKIGTPLLIVFIATCFILQEKTIQNKIYIFGKTVIALSCIVAMNAFFNEHITKEALQIPRPAHIKLCGYCQPKMIPETIYQGKEEDRKKTLTRLIEENKNHLSEMDPKVLNHWIDESGYSFPSGHSFNAFLIAVIISFSLYHSRLTWTKNLMLLPFLWAILVGLSRIALGAHSALDVSIGALGGLILGLTLLSFQRTRNLIMHQKNNYPL
jgi:phosphatidylglycerophosphatase B